jgi:ATP-dependent Clp protease protease subunit
MLFLESENPDKDIHSTSTRRRLDRGGLAIYDTMQFIKPDVSTLCVGMAGVDGRVPARRRAKGKRFALPNSDVMIPSRWEASRARRTDVEIHAKYILSPPRAPEPADGAHTPASRSSRLARDTERANFLTAEQARDSGIVDQKSAKSGRPGA